MIYNKTLTRPSRHKIKKVLLPKEESKENMADLYQEVDAKFQAFQMQLDALLV